MTTLMKRWLLLAWALLGVTTTAADSPAEFAVARDLEVVDAAPLQRVILPLDVHVGAVRADLGDLRVFATDGSVVPHGLAAVPRPKAAAPRRVELLPFALPDDLDTQSATARVQVATDGAIVSVAGASRSTAARRYVLDVRAALPLRALELDFSGSTALDARVSVAAGDDFARLQPLLDAAPLVRARQGASELRQLRLRLPTPLRQRYVRLDIAAAGAAPPLRAVWAESEVTAHVVTGTTGWRAAPATGDDVVMDLGARLPLHSVQVDPGVDGSLLRLRLACTRAAADSDGLGTAATWHELGTHRASRVRNNGAAMLAEPTSLGGVACRRLRLTAVEGSSWPASARLRVDYLPTELWFLARGPGRYMLAYGSGAVSSGAVPVAELRSAAGSAVAAARASLGAERALGGAARRADRPPPAWNTVLLWVALVIGVGCVVLLAVRMLRTEPSS